MPSGRLERPANGLGNRCSIHLSYEGDIGSTGQTGYPSERNVRCGSVCAASPER
jgi:hypothetical protein